MLYGITFTHTYIHTSHWFTYKVRGMRIPLYLVCHSWVSAIILSSHVVRNRSNRWSHSAWTLLTCCIVCKYVCMYVCMYVYMYVCMYVHVCMKLNYLLFGIRTNLLKNQLQVLQFNLTFHAFNHTYIHTYINACEHTYNTIHDMHTCRCDNSSWVSRRSDCVTSTLDCLS